jgi:hypothetical protein
VYFYNRASVPGEDYTEYNSDPYFVDPYYGWGYQFNIFDYSGDKCIDVLSSATKLYIPDQLRWEKKEI